MVLGPLLWSESNHRITRPLQLAPGNLSACGFRLFCGVTLTLETHLGHVLQYAADHYCFLWHFLCKADYNEPLAL